MCWVDDAGRACGRLRHCVRRRGPLESHWLDDGLQWAADCRPLQIGRLRRPTTSSSRRSSTSRTARAAGGLEAGARPAGAALAPSAASSSTPPMRCRALYEVHVCVLTGMFKAHINIFATRPRAQQSCLLPLHTRAGRGAHGPLAALWSGSPPCSARRRACGHSTRPEHRSMDDMGTDHPTAYSARSR